MKGHCPSPSLSRPVINSDHWNGDSQYRTHGYSNASSISNRYVTMTIEHNAVRKTRLRHISKSTNVHAIGGFLFYSDFFLSLNLFCSISLSLSQSVASHTICIHVWRFHLFSSCSLSPSFLLRSYFSLHFCIPLSASHAFCCTFDETNA